MNILEVFNTDHLYYHPRLKGIYDPIYRFLEHGDKAKRCVVPRKGLMVHDIAMSLQKVGWGMYPLFSDYMHPKCRKNNHWYPKYKPCQRRLGSREHFP